jgi:hypothetical protein
MTEEGSMDPRHSPQTCRWAEATLFLPLPYWLEAWNTPWTCRRDGPPRQLESTEECAGCPRFEARTASDVDWPVLIGL